MRSKEEKVAELFLNEPTKHWHFSKIVKTANISERAASIWLRKLIKEKFIMKVRPKGKMPFFVSNHEDPAYINKKRIYALKQLYSSGLLDKLSLLEKAKAIVLFGSFARGDWHSESDIDIFIMGDPEDLKYGYRALGREVQVHHCKNKQEIRKIESDLIKSVIKGYFVKGDVTDILELK